MARGQGVKERDSQGDMLTAASRRVGRLPKCEVSSN